MKNNWKMLLLGLMSTAVLLSGCGEEKQNQKVKTEAEETAYLSKLEKEIQTTDSNLLEYGERIKREISTLSQEGKDKAIDSYLYLAYQKQAEMVSMASGKIAEIQSLHEEGKDLNDPAILKDISNETTKVVIESVQKEGLKFKVHNNVPNIVPDTEWVLKTFKENMSEDLQTIVEFTNREFNNEFYTNQDGYQYDEIGERIANSEIYAEKFPNSYYYTSFVNAKQYYMQIYFLNDEISNSEGEVNKVVLDKYNEHKNKYKNTKFGKDIENVLTEYKKTNNVKTDEVVNYLTNLTSVNGE